MKVPSQQSIDEFVSIIILFFCCLYFPDRPKLQNTRISLERETFLSSEVPYYLAKDEKKVSWILSYFILLTVTD
mgnify:CR=1 FL=1